ncbi:DUF7289 family protein [Methanocella arvoryzae]|uniref:Uncharacterized protein n=1 Tax=Methanocella arvoryzae (strain DSM 22066 / NBRC 105507 / MRE50) TaxID=351160 RepID=Q0W740_METAR|nr:hypothetical protein [Methanocella arvoryzae]CAJ35803.1 hypothetical protein RCIX353 [Methanocella arvoryzae MRE50]
MKGSTRTSDAGVSESIGYIMISGILITSFILISTVGYPIFNAYIDEGHMKNVQESFDILAYNGNNVAMHNLPYASSEIKMYGGTLATRDTGYINISYYSDNAGTMPNILGFDNRTLTVLEYTKNTNRVAYVDGGVYALWNDGSTMIREPEIYSNGETFVYNEVPLMYSYVFISGNGPVQLTFSTPYYSKMSQSVYSVGAKSITGVHHIRITISGDYAEAIGNYMQQQFGFAKHQGSDGELILSKAFPGGIKLCIVPDYLVIENK